MNSEKINKIKYNRAGEYLLGEEYLKINKILGWAERKMALRGNEKKWRWGRFY